MKKLFSILLAAAMICSLSSVALAAESFTDVPTTHWAYADIMALADGGLVKGMGDGTFAPDKTLTIAKELYDRGVYVNSSLPPATAPTECLLRTSLMATHTEALIDEAAEFAAKCAAFGFETISMRDEFETIYKSGVTKDDNAALRPAA